MINDINKTIKELLSNEFPAELISQSLITFTFAAPDRSSLPNSVNLPAIDIFLYDIRENLELRTSEQLKSQSINDTQVRLIRSPVHINYSYIITAWSASPSNPEEDENSLLSMVLQTLLRYPTWPEEILQGSLVGIEPLPRAQVAQPGYLQHIGEFWSAMGGRPKPVIHYTVTVPLYPYAPIENVSLITKVVTDVANK